MSTERKEFWVAYGLFVSMERLGQACCALQTAHGTLIADGHDSAAVVGMVVDELIRVEEDIRKEIGKVDPGTLEALTDSARSAATTQ